MYYPGQIEFSRYSSVVFDLPAWAQRVLVSNMGPMEISAKESFEIYLQKFQYFTPIFEPIVFRKAFLDLFETKGIQVLRKIDSHNRQNPNNKMSNDYFWQLFLDLFKMQREVKKNFWCRVLEWIRDRLWNGWNKNVRKVDVFSREVAKVGMKGRGIKSRHMHLGKNFDRASKDSVKWL